MIGSPLVAWWVAHVGFWVLLVVAVLHDRRGVAAVCAALWVVGYFASGHIAPLSLFFMPFVAAIDVALVLIVFQRDIRLM